MTGKQFGRAAALALAGSMALSCALPAAAAEVIDDGVRPTYDEAYYATTDYYGNLTEGSVVKSYVLNGADTLTDRGVYDEVVNLTDGTDPTVSGDKITFHFDDAPSHFYFEGKTARPFEALPWTLAVHYTLNGVAAKAEDLAGKTGVVEILIDAIPNEDASEYARHNFVLAATAIFNQDDILSLEAPGAQLQLIGNLRMALFLAFPGEEQHFVIRVGAEDFSFGGMTFMMMPATLSQLEQIAELSERKDDLEDNYHKLSDSLDTLLDAFGNMQGSLNATANGLDELDKARSIISSGKGQVYADADTLRGDLDSLSSALGPVASEIDSASQALTDTQAVLQTMTGDVTSLREDLKTLKEDLEDLRDGKDTLEDVLEDLEDLEKPLKRLESALNRAAKSRIDEISSPLGEDMTSAQMKEALEKAKTLHTVYVRTAGSDEMDLTEFMNAALTVSGNSAVSAGQLAAILAIGSEEGARAAGEATAAAAGASEEEIAATGEQYAALYRTAAGLEQAYQAAGSGEELSFAQFLHGVLLLDPQYAASAAKTAKSLHKLYTLYEADPELVNVLILTADDLSDMLDDLNGSIAKVNTLLSSLADPTADVIGRLADMSDRVEDLEDLLDDGDDLIAHSAVLLGKVPPILDSVEALQAVLDTYEPEAQRALGTVKELSAAAADTVSHSSTFFDSFESLLKTSGKQLDTGTKDTLNGLSAALREAARSLSTTDDVKSAKNSISDIIEDTWDEHTGDIDNLLLMDATAEAVSLTSEENATPQSIQILIRTQEIEVEESDESTASTGAAVQSTTFFGRIAQMFKDLWAAITGIFH